MREPETTRTTEPAIEDSGVLVRDTEREPAGLGRLAITALLVIAILCIFFYGVTQQRNEVSGPTPPAEQHASTSVPPPSGSQAQPPANRETTGSTARGEGH
jgi:hypothetical protein